MSNKTYDILKNIALIVLPALATITAVDVFLGALLKISSSIYADKQELKARRGSK